MRATVRYLAVRGATPGPLIPPSQRPTRKVRAALVAARLDAQGYSGHSFRIGAASTAAAKGVKHAFIQIVGRWHYMRYIKSTSRTASFSGADPSFLTETV